MVVRASAAASVKSDPKGPAYPEDLRDLRGLTIKGRWAELVVNGEKRIENRSWRCRPGQLLAIHRGGPGGAIVGLARVKACISVDEAVEEYPEQCPHIGGPVCWVLEEAVAFREPIACRGALRLWFVDDSLLLQIRERLSDG